MTDFNKQAEDALPCAFVGEFGCAYQGWHIGDCAAKYRPAIVALLKEARRETWEKAIELVPKNLTPNAALFIQCVFRAEAEKDNDHPCAI